MFGGKGTTTVYEGPNHVEGPESGGKWGIASVYEGGSHVEAIEMAPTDVGYAVDEKLREIEGWWPLADGGVGYTVVVFVAQDSDDRGGGGGVLDVVSQGPSTDKEDFEAGRVAVAVRSVLTNVERYGPCDGYRCGTTAGKT